jgi:predicted glycoside hydrolase/deacetylase ChbG (UPF0249 family)
MPERSPEPVQLIITADDWGSSPRYNAGILEAARGAAIDSVSAMVQRPWCDPASLLESGVEVGLHLELSPGMSERVAAAQPARQAELFERLFGAPPAYIDGHHHCHAAAPLEAGVEELALSLRVPVRAVGEVHARRLQRRGISRPDRLIGRIAPGEPVLPDVIAAALDGKGLPEGVTEWMVHPGYSDPAHRSSYDEAREEDLHVLLELAADPAIGAARASHREALAP